jgi:hypothetical protein
MAFGFLVEPSPFHRWVASCDPGKVPNFRIPYILTARLNEVHDRDLRLRVGVDVPLGRPEVRVSGQHLHVAKRPSDRGYLPRRVGDEGPSSAVA